MNLRVATFVVAAAAFALGWNGRHGRLWYWAGGAALGGFCAAVEYHEHVRRQLQRNGLLRQINQQAIARLDRDWKALPNTPVAVPPQHRAAADDLDLFGHASLFHFLNLANTPIGIRLLARLALGTRTARRDPAPATGRDRACAAPGLAPGADSRRPLVDGSRRGHGTVRGVGGRRSLACRAALAVVVVSDLARGRPADPRFDGRWRLVKRTGRCGILCRAVPECLHDCAVWGPGSRHFFAARRSRPLSADVRVDVCHARVEHRIGRCEA